MANFLRRVDFDVDQPIVETELDPSEYPAVLEYLRYCLREMGVHGATALWLFYHEADDCVRACIWQPQRDGAGTWYEMIPMGSECGRRVLRELRRRTRRRKNEHSRISGVLRCMRGGSVQTLTVDSPHDWEVRIYAGDDRPPGPPYELHFAGVMGGQ